MADLHAQVFASNELPVSDSGLEQSPDYPYHPGLHGPGLLLAIGGIPQGPAQCGDELSGPGWQVVVNRHAQSVRTSETRLEATFLCLGTSYGGRRIHLKVRAKL